MAHEFDMLVVLNEIKELLKKQNEILEQQNQPQTKITVVGNKVQTNQKGLQNTEDFTL
jgi:hypothetical protein